MKNILILLIFICSLILYSQTNTNKKFPLGLYSKVEKGTYLKFNPDSTFHFSKQILSDEHNIFGKGKFSISTKNTIEFEFDDLPNMQEKHYLKTSQIKDFKSYRIKLNILSNNIAMDLVQIFDEKSNIIRSEYIDLRYDISTYLNISKKPSRIKFKQLNIDVSLPNKDYNLIELEYIGKSSSYTTYFGKQKLVSKFEYENNVLKLKNTELTSDELRLEEKNDSNSDRIYN